MKSLSEFDNQFDVLYNNITSNQAPGLNSFEKSSFLTKAQNELVKNYFDPNSKGNSLGKGFDESAIRQMDFSNLLESIEKAPINDTPVIDHRAKVYELPTNVFIIINEEITLKGGITSHTETTYYTWNGDSWLGSTSIAEDATIKGTVSSVSELPKTELTVGDIYAVAISINNSTTLATRQVIPISFQEYMRLMSKPFKEPLKRQAWRLMTKGGTANKIEIVLPSTDLTKYPIRNYVIRYVRKPKPIILTDLSDYGDLTIEGQSSTSMCELNESTHDAIIQRAVELAKIAWAGDANDIQATVTSGQRSE